MRQSGTPTQSCSGQRVFRESGAQAPAAALGGVPGPGCKDGLGIPGRSVQPKAQTKGDKTILSSLTKLETGVPHIAIWAKGVRGGLRVSTSHGAPQDVMQSDLAQQLMRHMISGDDAAASQASSQSAAFADFYQVCWCVLCVFGMCVCMGRGAAWDVIFCNCVVLVGGCTCASRFVVL